MIFGHNKRKLYQETFYIGKDQIEITHEYNLPWDWFLLAWPLWTIK